MKRGRQLLWASTFMMFLIVMLPVCFADTLSLIYDKNGNLVSGDGLYREYNSLNQLEKVYNGSDSSGLLLEEFTYHPTEERVLVKKVYANDSTLKETVYYIDDNFVRIVNNSGSYDYTYVKHNGQLVAQLNPDNSKYFVHNDHLGSSSVITNESGDVVENTTYEPFGEVVEGGEATRFSYEGKEFDSVVGDLDFHFRKYKPQWAIFLQPDTLLQNVYDPQLLNRYSFERNNPYKHTDEDGHTVTDGFIKADDANLGQSKGGGAIGILAEIANIGNNILNARDDRYQFMNQEYQKYYPKTYETTSSIMRSADYSSQYQPDPEYDELEEWYEKRGFDIELDPNQEVSLETSSFISTRNTFSYSAPYSQAYSSYTSGGFYDTIARLGGSVTIRNSGISQGVISVYYREGSDGSVIKRYQYHNDKKSQRSWEKKHKNYKPYTK